MLIALISDVHGNLPALEAVLADAQAAGAQHIWCLGDTAGYGPFVNECLELVEDSCALVLAGNHDLAVRGDLPAGMFGGTAGAGVRYSQSVLSERSRAFLDTLGPQRIMPDAGIELYHASSRDPVWEYVRDPQSAIGHFSAQRLPLSFVGHSHLQLMFELSGGGRFALGGLRADGDVVELTPGAQRVMNPGSVGQPRDREPRAGWALLEPDVRVTFRRSEYDIPRMQAAVAAAGLPPELGERLLLGW
jgi:predicted phosphodiesterase